MNFELSAEQVMLREMLHRFVAEQCDRDTVRDVVDGTSTWSHRLWREMQTIDLLGTGIAEEEGGAGGTLTEVCLVAEAMGRGMAPVPFVSTALAAQVIARFGNETQRSRWLPRIIRGEAKATVAELTGTMTDGILSGTAAIALDGGIAEFALLVSPSLLAIIALDAPQVDRQELISLDPARSAARLTFEAAPVDTIDAAAALDWWQDAAAVLVAFEQLGGADRAIEMTRAHVLERRSFGRAIGSYQAVKHRLVDMHVKALIARAHAYHGAWALMTDVPHRRLAIASARVAATESYRFAARESVQLHGAMGTSWEHDAHLHLRRAETLGLIWGGSSAWKERIIEELEKAHG